MTLKYTKCDNTLPKKTLVATGTFQNAVQRKALKKSQQSGRELWGGSKWPMQEERESEKEARWEEPLKTEWLAITQI